MERTDSRGWGIFKDGLNMFECFKKHSIKLVAVVFLSSKSEALSVSGRTLGLGGKS